MPIIPPLLEEQASLNAWNDEVTRELNDVQDDVAVLEAIRNVNLSELQTAAAAMTYADFRTAILALM